MKKLVIAILFALLSTGLYAQLFLEAGAARTDLRGPGAPSQDESLYSPSATLRWHHQLGPIGYGAAATWLREGTLRPEQDLAREHSVAGQLGLHGYFPTFDDDYQVFLALSAFVLHSFEHSGPLQYGPALGWHFQGPGVSFSIQYRIGMREKDIRPHVLSAAVGIPLMR